MGMLLPAISLAVMHIAGDNVGVVPDAAALLGPEIYIVTILAYMFFGALITGVSAWIGAVSGFELGVLVGRQFGCRGKKLLAMCILTVSIPASALTGGYFCGWLVHNLTGLSQPVAVVICLVSFTLLAAGYLDQVLVVVKYGSLLLVPLILVLFCFVEGRVALPALRFWNIDWMLILALISYNACGMRPVLVAEAASYLAKRGGSTVGQAVGAKIVEGTITAIIAFLVIMTGSHGPLALSAGAVKLLGTGGGMFFNCILLCVFINTMIPAMMVNAKQTAIVTGLSFRSALMTAGLTVYAVTFLKYDIILNIMSCTGFLMVGFILYTAYILRKKYS